MHVLQCISWRPAFLTRKAVSSQLSALRSQLIADSCELTTASAGGRCRVCRPARGDSRIRGSGLHFPDKPAVKQSFSGNRLPAPSFPYSPTDAPDRQYNFFAILIIPIIPAIRSFWGLDAYRILLQSRTRSGGESGLVAGLDFKSSCGSPEGGLGGFDSHAPPPAILFCAISLKFGLFRVLNAWNLVFSKREERWCASDAIFCEAHEASALTQRGTKQCSRRYNSRGRAVFAKCRQPNPRLRSFAIGLYEQFGGAPPKSAIQSKLPPCLGPNCFCKAQRVFRHCLVRSLAGIAN